MTWLPPHIRSRLDPVKPANAIVYVDDSSQAVAVDVFGRLIDGPSTDHASVVKSTIDKVGKGRIILVGKLLFTSTVDVKPGIVIEGMGLDETIITAPAGAPAFRYKQPTGSTAATFRPLVVKNLTVKIQETGGPHKAIEVDCSAYGCAEALLEEIQVDGWMADGAYDKDSVTPHVGLDFNKVWNFVVEKARIIMPGICVRMTNYGIFRDVYINGGANGYAVGILIDGYRARLKGENLVTETKARPAIKSTQASLYVDCIECHFEGAGFDKNPPEPVIELDYPSGTYEVALNFTRLAQRYVALNINKVYGSSRRWFNMDNEMHGVWQPWAHSVVNGTPTVSFVEDRIVVDNTGGTVDADVDVPMHLLVYNEIRVGGRIKGVGEAQFIYGTKLSAIGIDTSGNLYLRMADTSVPYDESIVVDTSAAGDYDVLGFIELQAATKHIVVGVGGVYTSKIATFSRSLGFFAPTIIRLHVPAGQKLEFTPRLYRYYA